MKGSVALVVCLTVCFLLAIYAQQPVETSDLTSLGIAPYERGETESAIKTLREALKKSKRDARAWHYLGSAFVRQGNHKEAREAFEKAITLQSRLFEEALRRQDDEWRDEQLSSIKALLGEEIETQSKLLEIVTDKQAMGKGELALERFRVQADCMEQNTKLVDGHTVFSKSEMKIQRPQVLVQNGTCFSRKRPSGKGQRNCNSESHFRDRWDCEVYRDDSNSRLRVD